MGFFDRTLERTDISPTITFRFVFLPWSGGPFNVWFEVFKDGVTGRVDFDTDADRTLKRTGHPDPAWALPGQAIKYPYNLGSYRGFEVQILPNRDRALDGQWKAVCHLEPIGPFVVAPIACSGFHVSTEATNHVRYSWEFIHDDPRHLQLHAAEVAA